MASNSLANEEAKSRFLREARAAAALQHPNIYTVHEIDEAGGQTFAAMAYIDGESLEKKIEAGPLELGEALVSAARFILGWADLIRICSLGFCIYLH